MVVAAGEGAGAAVGEVEVCGEAVLGGALVVAVREQSTVGRGNVRSTWARCSL